MLTNRLGMIECNGCGAWLSWFHDDYLSLQFNRYKEGKCAERRHLNFGYSCGCARAFLDVTKQFLAQKPPFVAPKPEKNEVTKAVESALEDTNETQNAQNKLDR